MASCALIDVLGVLTLPDALYIPQILHQHLRAVHELLPVSHVDSDGATVPSQVRTVLPILVPDATPVQLEVEFWNLKHRLVVVEAEHVERARDLQMLLKVEE